MFICSTKVYKESSVGFEFEVTGFCILVIKGVLACAIIMEGYNMRNFTWHKNQCKVLLSVLVNWCNFKMARHLFPATNAYWLDGYCSRQYQCLHFKDVKVGICLLRVFVRERMRSNVQIFQYSPEDYGTTEQSWRHYYIKLYSN